MCRSNHKDIPVSGEIYCQVIKKNTESSIWSKAGSAQISWSKTAMMAIVEDFGMMKKFIIKMMALKKHMKKSSKKIKKSEKKCVQSSESMI